MSNRLVFVALKISLNVKHLLFHLTQSNAVRGVSFDWGFHWSEGGCLHWNYFEVGGAFIANCLKMTSGSFHRLIMFLLYSIYVILLLIWLYLFLL